MKRISTPELSETSSCPYLEKRSYRQEYFLGVNGDSDCFQTLLDARWRRFGVVFFRPVCPDCRKCIPIRVDVRRFKPSKSQKRVLKKNKRTGVRFSSLSYKPEMFRIYEKHSRVKFDQSVTEEEFFRSFFQPAVPSFQSEFYADNQMVGFGILDIAATGLSTVYFAYDPDFSVLSPGTFSILSEIEETKNLGLDYYYSGYYVKECSRMAYKGQFHPYELLIDGTWHPEKTPDDPV